MEHSNDISLHFLHCPECDTQWRSHHLQTCEHCSTMGLTLLLNEAQIEVLMEAVRTQFYGVNDETDLLFVLSEMRDWSDVPTALLAQACWMHLSGDILCASQGSQSPQGSQTLRACFVQACFAQTHPSPEEIEIAKEYFEERFQDSLQEYLMEAQAPPYPLPCASQTYPLPCASQTYPLPVELTAEE